MQEPDEATPEQRIAASHARSVRQLSTVRIPLYGLPIAWSGSRLVGATGFEHGLERGPDGRMRIEMHESVELIHETPSSGQLRVESSDIFGSVDDDALAGLLAEFNAKRRHEGRPAPDRLEPHLSVQTVTVDGRVVAFAAARCEQLLVARWAGYELTITVKADGWPLDDLELERVADIGPYLEGRRRRLEQVSGFRLA